MRTKALAKMISSNEILTLINALGLDPKSQEIDLKDLRYGKIIIMTDADVDGSHIATLLITFFYKYMKQLIDEKRLFLAMPPLFKIYDRKVLLKLLPIVSESFNVFLELPLKVITRGYRYEIIPISWSGRIHGNSKFNMHETGSMYIFTLLYCLFEKILLNKRVK